MTNGPLSQEEWQELREITSAWQWFQGGPDWRTVWDPDGPDSARAAGFLRALAYVGPITAGDGRLSWRAHREQARTLLRKLERRLSTPPPTSGPPTPEGTQ